MDRESLRLLLEQGHSVEKIAGRFGRHPSTVAYWMRRHGLVAAHSDRHAARGGIVRGDLEALVDAGLSIAEIAVEVDRSKATVRHWLAKYGLRTQQTQRRAARRELLVAARSAGSEPPAVLRMNCPVHGDTDHVREGSGYYRCRSCRAESVATHRRRLKELLVREAGGRCVICGYDRHFRALEFHHVEPADKLFALSRKGVTLSLEALRAEARKCVLVCSNCHAELESGARQLPDTVAHDGAA